MISGVNETTGQPLALDRIPKKTLEREDFMLLFIKQLQYQDPMKPIENNEMAMQMAMFSQVDQLFEMNESLQHFVETMESFQLLSASNLMGKLVRISGNTVRVENGEFLGASFELEEPASRVEVVIRNLEGAEVKRLELGALPAGTHEIEWDATDASGQTVPDGIYRISVVLPESGETVTPKVWGMITGAEIGEETVLVVNDQEEVGLTEIEEIRNP